MWRSAASPCDGRAGDAWIYEACSRSVAGYIPVRPTGSATVVLSLDPATSVRRFRCRQRHPVGRDDACCCRKHQNELLRGFSIAASTLLAVCISAMLLVRNLSSFGRLKTGAGAGGNCAECSRHKNNGRT